jgi:hypothetical protein
MKRIERWLLLAVVVLSYQPHCMSQGFRVDPFGLDGQGGYWTKWDSVQDKLILYRNTTDSAVPGARVFAKDGASVPIYPMRDLPASRFVDIWNAAATPDGGIVLSAIVGYTPRTVKPAQLKSLLLTYSGDGKLKKVWNVEPYHHLFLAADRDGNVFALGSGNLDEPYPLLVKYSPAGEVLRETFSSSLFPQGEKVIEAGSPNGDSGMFIRGATLFVWLSDPQELLRFSLSGDLLSRTYLAQTLNRLAAETGSDRVTVKLLTAAREGETVAQVQLWPKPNGDPVRSVMVRLSANGSKSTLVPIAPNPVWFLGSNEEGKLVFLQPERDGKAAAIIEY